MRTAELTEYLELQAEPTFITKTELAAALRERGLAISSRNLTYYTTVGLLPPAVRVGSRAGAYPEVVIQQLAWIIRARERGQSIESIRELLPLWRWLMRNRRGGVVDLSELELVARTGDLSPEASYAVPYLVSEVLLCLCGRCLSELEWVLKDGTSVQHGAGTSMHLTFLMGEVNELTGEATVAAWTQLVFPDMGYPDPDAPTCITLGLPVGVRIGAGRKGGKVAKRRCTTPPGSGARQLEVLPLG